MGKRFLRFKLSPLLLALSLVCALLFALSFPVHAQQPSKVPRIGYMSGGSPSSSAPFIEAFRQGLRELDYVEGRNIKIEERFAEGKFDRFPDLAAELVRVKVDVIVAAGQPAIRAAMQATKTIPIVMAISGDAVETGLVASLARPGGNLTGLSILAPELTGKRLELLKEAVPKVSRVAVLWNPTNQDSQLNWKATQATARALGLTLQSLEVQDANEFAGTFAAMKREQADSLYVLGDPLTVGNRGQIATLALKYRMPGIYFWKEFVDAAV